MKIAIVGAGIPGLAIAFHLARQGFVVEVLEAATPGAGASAAAIGSLSPYRPHEVHTLANAQIDSLAAMPAFMAAASEISGLPHGHSTPGRLQLIDSAYLPFALQPFLDKANARWAGLTPETPAELLGADEVARRWGRFFKNADTFVFDRVSQQLHVETALVCLLAAFIKLGGKVQSGINVHEVSDSPTHVLLKTSAGDKAYDRVILCAGMGLRDLHHNGAPSLPVQPLYGEGFTVKGFLPAGAPGILAGKRYVHHWANGTASIGSTTHDELLVPPPYAAAATEISRTLQHYLADEGVLKPLRIWSGARPTAAGQKPFVGALSRQVFAVGGLYKVGFSLMAYAASEAEKFVRDLPLSPPLDMNRRA